VLLAVVWSGVARASDASGGAPFEAPFARAPLDPPIVLTGNFGESRSGRYHGGLDFSTGGGVGRALYAPLPGWIERVRASGGGFGRSIYLRATDGRLLVFAHLDAFDEPLASFVDEAQERSGEYEQDLWPGRDRFGVEAGQRIAWTGESGAGPPHLHMEVRRGDVAYNPLRAGMVIEDGTAPVLRRLTLEPLDGASWVERSPAPWTRALGGTADTIVVEGRVRAIVEARDGASGNGLRLAPWSTGVSFAGVTVACQFDSATWGGDMADADYVYDHGRSGPGNGVVLWHAGRFRPTVILGGHGLSDAAIEVRPGDPARALEVSCVDVEGHRDTHTLWLRGPAAAERGPDTTRTGPPARAGRGSGAFELAVLPGRNVRVTFHDAPAGSRNVRVCGVPAVWSTGRWTVIVPFDSVLATRGGAAGRDPGMARLDASGIDAAGGDWRRSERPDAQTDDGARWSFSAAGPFECWLDADAVYEPALLTRTRDGAPRGTAELTPLSDAWSLEPSNLALRSDAQLRIVLPGATPPARVDMYRASGRGWSPLGARFDSTSRSFEAGTRTLGQFTLMADTLAPRIALRRPRGGMGAHYSQWMLEASLSEAGSGVDRSRSWIEVDGRRVPTEWDGERQRLRWRPLKRPARGSHAYEVVATDVAGNARRERGSFVLN
jgi:hypothetical protein